MDPLTCPLGTSWCTDHEPPDAPDNWAECVRIIGTVVLDHGPATAGFRSEARSVRSSTPSGKSKVIRRL